MQRYYIVFKNGVKFFVLADSWAIVSGNIKFTRATVVQPDFVLESEVAAVLTDGTDDDSGNGSPLIG